MFASTFLSDGTQSGHTSLLRQFVPILIEKGFDVEIVALGGITTKDAPCKVHILQNLDHQLEWGLFKNCFLDKNLF